MRLPSNFSQLGLNVWERLRSISGLRGERPVAFTGREREREEEEGEWEGKRVQGELGVKTDIFLWYIQYKYNTMQT